MADTKAPKASRSFESWVFSDKGMRAAMVEAVKEFKPQQVNCDLAQVQSAKAFVVAEINALPDDLNFVQVTIEATSNERARQVNVVILPQSVRA